MPSEQQLDQKITKTLQFHERLNPAIWDNEDDMRLEVRLRLLRTAIAFLKFVDVPSLRISDIVTTGSNAAFNYTEDSDIDVHLIVDYSKAICPTIAENFFNTKKNLWNTTHDVTIRGMPIEIYIEDERHPAYSNGLYSLVNGQWLRKASHQAPKMDDAAILVKTNFLASQIDTLIDTNATPEEIAKFQAKLSRMRKSGLAKGGEFSVENLTFKALRSLGYLEVLYNQAIKGKDRSLSLAEMFG